MKERISSEINSGVNKGKKYADEITRNTFSLVRFTSRAVFGEVEFQRTGGGQWTVYTVRPGLRHIRSIIR